MDLPGLSKTHQIAIGRNSESFFGSLSQYSVSVIIKFLPIAGIIGEFCDNGKLALVQSW